MSFRESIQVLVQQLWNSAAVQPRSKRQSGRIALMIIISEGKWDGFFEIHAENYMGAGGPPHDALIRSPPVSYSPSSDRSNWPWIGATSPMLRHRPALFADRYSVRGMQSPFSEK